MPLKLTTAERRRVAMIRKRLDDMAEGAVVGKRLLGPLLEKHSLMREAMDGIEGDQNNLRWLLAILDREDARE